jgi:pilus assembly protein Flp/PilA
MKELVKALWKDESGATAIEYGLIAGLMAAVLITAIGGFGDKLTELFDAINKKLEDITNDIPADNPPG